MGSNSALDKGCKAYNPKASDLVKWLGQKTYNRSLELVHRHQEELDCSFWPPYSAILLQLAT